jgi:hypothetical protein
LNILTLFTIYFFLTKPYYPRLTASKMYRINVFHGSTLCLLLRIMWRAVVKRTNLPYWASGPAGRECDRNRRSGQEDKDSANTDYTTVYSAIWLGAFKLWNWFLQRTELIMTRLSDSILFYFIFCIFLV